MLVDNTTKADDFVKVDDVISNKCTNNGKNESFELCLNLTAFDSKVSRDCYN